MNYDANTVKACVLGMAVGDALGVPYEFEERGTFHCTGYYCDHGAQPVMDSRWSGIEPGAWSDDTSMALAMMDSVMKEKGKISMSGMMEEFILWWYGGKNCAMDGRPFGLGGCVQRAMQRYRRRIPAEQCGGRDESDNGNGSLMRILPLTFGGFSDEEIRKASAVTHAHEQSTEACVIAVHLARALLEGRVLNDAVKEEAKRTEVAVYKDLYESICVPEHMVKSTGYVVDTLKTALWCLAHGGSYREAVLSAVNFGYDTDTVACITGGLAGIAYGLGGEKGIPQSWIYATRKTDFISEKCERYFMTLQ